MGTRQSAETSARAVNVVRYAPSSLKGEVLAPRGSIVVYLATVGSQRLDAIRAAARSGDAGDRLLGEVDQVPQDVVARVSLQYGDHLLAADVPVPSDGSPVRLILPYNGGELIAKDLLVLEKDAQRKVDAVAVVHDPPISRVEHAALMLVPRDSLHLNLGAALAGGIAGTNDEERRRQEEERRRAAQEGAIDRAEGAGLAAEARAEDRAAERAAGGRFGIHLLDQTIITLGPTLAAAELLELRRDILKG
jgi:hypothetical protein